MRGSNSWASAAAIALCAAAIFLALPARAHEPQSLIDKALKNAGISGQLEALSDVVISSIPEDAFPDRKIKRDTGAFLKETASKETLLALVRSAVQDLDKESLEKVIKFYDSRLGKKVGRLQDTALDADVLKGIREGRTVLASMNESRLAVFEKIATVERVSEVNANLLNAVVEGLMEGYASEGSKKDREGETIRRQVRMALKEAAGSSNRNRELALLSLAHTYRSLDDKELQELAAFSESEAGSRFRTSVQKGLEAAAGKMGRALGTAVARWRLQAEKGANEKTKQDSE
ncbi:MAG TPA: hypothetical protein VMC85_07615 [Desulfomonilaceae bacterium]|nr:hypothetical protein [Desulfomonilaceae bacterium]